MAAPRTYNDQQRDAIWRLYEAGMKSPEITAACEAGRTGLARFKIPDRTVRDILAKMAQEIDRKLPTTVIELESAEAMERAPARAARIVEAELKRLEEKQAGGRLTDSEVDRLPKLATYSVRIKRLLQEPKGRTGRGGSAGNGTKPEPRQESAIERLAREARESAGDEPHPSPTRACQPPSDSTPPTPARRDGNGEGDTAAPVTGPTAQRRAEAAAAIKRVAAEHGIEWEGTEPEQHDSQEPTGPGLNPRARAAVQRREAA